MPTTAPSLVVRDPAALLDRHTTRRKTGVPTISVLIGSIGAGGRTWRHWANSAGRAVVSTTTNTFPHHAWLQSAIDHLPLSPLAFSVLAQQTQHHPDELQASWRNKSPADRDQWWLQRNPSPDDSILRTLADEVDQANSTTFATRLLPHGDKGIATLLRLDPLAAWPTILWTSTHAESLLTMAPLWVAWAMRSTNLPIALSLTPKAWADYLAQAPESRVKTILQEGECFLPTIDETAAKQQLLAAGASPDVVPKLLAQTQGDPELLANTLELFATTQRQPATEDEDNQARSKAEQYVYEQLQNIPELADRFTLNAELDFRFGHKRIEIDLLCSSPKIAVEIDGYYHFKDAENYRRDRRKDWELQKRGYLVLRFLAADVAQDWEMIRDRIQDALRRTPLEEPH